MTPPERPAGTARKLLLAAAVIVVIEALTFVVLAVLAITDLSSFGVGTGVFLAAYGLGQAWAAWRVLQGDSWARSPLVVTQILQLVTGFTLSGIPAWVTALLVAAAVVVLGCLLAPPVTRALNGEEPV